MKSSKPSVRLQLEAAARFMAEEKYPEALIEYRVALATDPNNLEAVMGAKNAQDGIARMNQRREEMLKKEVIDKFQELEIKQREAAEAKVRELEAADD